MKLIINPNINQKFKTMELTLEQVEKVVTDAVLKTGTPLTSSEISKLTNQIQKCSLNGLQKRAIIFNEAFVSISKLADATETGKEPISSSQKKAKETVTTLPNGQRI